MRRHELRAAAHAPLAPGWVLLAALIASSDRPAAQFRAVALTAEPRAALAVEGPAWRFEARGDVLYRVSGDRALALGCTLPGGPGAIAAVASQRNGTTYLAAERGLFMTSPDVDVIDPLDLRDGIPPGQLLGVHVDARDKLWVATDRALACLDSTFFYGRTWATEDGLPEPPLTGFAVAPDGALLVRNQSGWFEYRPGSLPPPDVEIRRVAGAEFRRGEPVAVTGAAALDLDARGAGSLTFRYRKAGHHLWQPLEGAKPALPAVPPGRTAFEVVALDRELGASAPVTVALDTPYPLHYSKPFLLGAGALASLAVLLLFWTRARGRGPRARARALLSAGLVLVLGLQLLAGVLGHGRSWPFVGFSMYTERYHEGSLVYKMALVGIRPDGSRAEISVSRSGIATDGQQQQIVPLIDGGEPALRKFVADCNRLHPGDPLAGVSVVSKRYRLTRDGPVAVAPIVHAHYTER